MVRRALQTAGVVVQLRMAVPGRVGRSIELVGASKPTVAPKAARRKTAKVTEKQR
jgi:hypothetical protein